MLVLLAAAAFAEPTEPPLTEVCRYPDLRWFSGATLELVGTSTGYADFALQVAKVERASGKA